VGSAITQQHKCIGPIVVVVDRQIRLVGPNVVAGEILSCIAHIMQEISSRILWFGIAHVLPDPPQHETHLLEGKLVHGQRAEQSKSAICCGSSRRVHCSREPMLPLCQVAFVWRAVVRRLIEPVSHLTIF
jgi:hypothetical protein